MDLIKFVKILMMRKFVLIGIPIFTMTLSYFLLKHTPDVYRSKAKIATGITDDFKTSIEDSESRKPHVIANKFSNLIELIKARPVIDLLSYKLILNDLTEDYHFRDDGEFLSSLSQDRISQVLSVCQSKYDSLDMLTSMNESERTLIEILEEKKYDYKNLIEKIKVYRLDMSDFIEIEFESENPHLSSFVVNQLITEFIKYYKYISSKKSDNSVNFFRDLAEQKKQELDDIVNRMKNYKLQNGIINLYEQTEAIVDQIAKVEIMREEDNKLISSLNEAIKEIDRKLTGREALYAEANMRPYHQEISQLKEEIQSVNQQVIFGSSSDEALRGYLNDLKDSLNVKVKLLTDEIVVDPNVSKQDLITKRIEYTLQLEIAKNSVISIDKELERLYNVAAGFAPSEAFISSYSREISVAEEVYILMLNKLNTATFNSLNLAGAINQIEEAIPADKPEASKKLLLMILSGIVSFVFTVVIIFILEYLDLTVKSPLEFNLLVNLPLIGIINQLKANKLDLKDIFNNLNTSTEFTSFKQLLRMLRVEVENNIGNKGSLLVTSTRRATGKTLHIISLAYSLSLTGKRVLIIDANLSNNQLTRQFNVKPTFQQILSGESDLQTGIQKTEWDNIDIVGCEKSTLSPVEINGSQSIKELIDQGSLIYDYVLIEGAQLNNSSDSKELLKYVNNLLVIFSASDAISNADKNSIEFLKEQKNKFVGAVLNNVGAEHLESVLGEIPRERTRIRIMTKKYLSRNFGKSNIQNRTSVNV
jgi:Mrp family chromosome partitioning ATPase/uncharacterized protein involved in exopolysaccharide biosynthesis